MEFEAKVPKQKNPRTTTNTLSAVLFLYLIPVLWKFYKKNVGEEDLYEVLEEHKSSKLGDRLEHIWNQKRRGYGKFSLHFALLQQFGLEFVAASFLMLVAQTVVIIITPLGVSGLVTCYQNGPINRNQSDAYYYAGLILFGLGLRNAFGHPVLMWTTHLCMKMRVACCSLIYRKALRLSPTALSQVTIGQMVNLLSNDVNRFDQKFCYCYYILISPIQTAIALYMLYLAIGRAAFYGMVFLLVFVPVQIFLGNANSSLRLKTAVHTDERLRLMNEILFGINVIKMYAWELPFAKLVSSVRRSEIKAAQARFHVEAILRAMQMFVTRTSVFITILVYLSLGNNISANVVYLITTTYNILRTILTSMFSVAIMSLAEIHVSVVRVNKFLDLEELQSQKLQYSDSKNILSTNKCREINETETPKVSLNKVNVKWFTHLQGYSLQDINLHIDKSHLVAVVGPVGSGKTTLLNVILNELVISNGNLDITGKVSYASQEPWLFHGTIQQNILFGDKYEENRYKEVLYMCALEPDLKMFAFGDKTVISENGKSLSGGQRARINLARCLYRDADVYLLDDPLSAVDINVGNHLFEQCIKRFLSNKICILTTHQLQYIKDSDIIVVLTNGKMVSKGSYKEIQCSGLDFATLLQQNNLENEQDQLVIEKVPSEREFCEDVEIANQNDYSKETIASGGVAVGTYSRYIKAGRNCLFIFFLLSTIIAAYGTCSFSDYFVAYWVNFEKAMNGNETVSNIQISLFLNKDRVIYIYSTITGLIIILALGHNIMFFIHFLNASANLHNLVFKKIIFARMRFFDTNPIGRILNRFSNDVGIVDEYIPLILADIVGLFFVLISAIVISITINIWLLFVYAASLALLYWVRAFYINTSRNIKRIEAMARSPVYNHIVATVSGLPTVRSFEVQNVVIKEFDSLQDCHSSAWYLFVSLGRGFAAWLDFISFITMGSVILCLLVVSQEYQGGDIGLVISQYLAVSGLMQWGLRQWCELETNIISVERVLEYNQIKMEPKKNYLQALTNKWPNYGKIIFQNVSLKYSVNGPTALKNCNFIIEGGEKIGIVGRTGAGKTSIIAALFQLYDVEGSIIIDNVDIAKVPIYDLRSKISIIPQEPVLFSGTIRKNLDPLEEYSDEVLWTALKQVELKPIVENIAGGLSATVAECGSNFSIGQKQLICLARAIIRNNKILVLDEATANVDPYTDSIIQKTLRQQFVDSTVITIAHRLHTIMDSDRVLVMKTGAVVEFDKPHNLLQMTNSLFYTMANASGNLENFLAITKARYKKLV